MKNKLMYIDKSSIPQTQYATIGVCIPSKEVKI